MRINKKWHRRRPRRRNNTVGRFIIFFALALLLCWAWLLLTTVSLAEHQIVDGALVSSSSNGVGQNADVAQPVYGTQVVWGTIEAVYALPNPADDIKGIVLLLHACTHNAFKFFAPSNSCQPCVGLTEEMRIVRLVISREYAALAVTCNNKQSGCWADTDIPRLEIALGNFQKLVLPKKISSNSIIAIGASSGGHMAAKLVAEGQADAALIMVMSLGAALQNRLSDVRSSSSHPLYLAPMPRDQTTTRKAEENYQALKQAAFPVIFDKTSCAPLPVTAAYLSSRLPGMTGKIAERIIEGLLQAQHLKEDNYMLQKDPTQSNWREVLQKTDLDDTLERTRSAKTADLLWGKFVLTPGKSPLAKALHRAWAFHEYCSEVVEPALDFFEQTLGGGELIK